MVPRNPGTVVVEHGTDMHNPTSNDVQTTCDLCVFKTTSKQDMEEHINTNHKNGNQINGEEDSNKKKTEEQNKCNEEEENRVKADQIIENDTRPLTCVTCEFFAVNNSEMEFHL